MPHILKQYFGLTPAQITDLNRLTAMAILGWRYHEFSNHDDQLWSPDIPDVDGCPQVRRIPKYTENMQYAWEVFEKILEKHSHSGSDKWSLGEKSTDAPFATFYRNENSETSYTVIAETMPLAICICALLVVEKNVDLVLKLSAGIE